MKSEDIHDLINKFKRNSSLGLVFTVDDVIQITTNILSAMLDHIDLLNGRSDVIAEVAEGHMVIMRAEDVVPIDIHQKLRRDFVRAYRELVMLNAAVGDCENGRITVNSIRPRQSDLLARDEKYQRAIGNEPRPERCFSLAENDGQLFCTLPFRHRGPHISLIDWSQPHSFILDTTSGLTHTTYRVCKCGLSEFNVMHTREDTNAKANQDSSQP